MKIYIYYVYILTNEHKNVLYTGVTNNLERRCSEHKSGNNRGFTQKYNCEQLVFFEKFDLIGEAIEREKQIKGYSRSKKLALIEHFNKGWRNLYAKGIVELP